MQTTFNLTYEQRTIIIFGLQARITELEKRIETFEFSVGNFLDDKERTENFKRRLPEIRNELAETIALLEEMEF